MSAPVPLRLCDLLPELSAAQSGVGPAHRVGLRAATPRSCRRGPGPRLSAKKRTPARPRSARKENARREMFSSMDYLQPNDSKNILDVSVENHDYKNYVVSTPQSSNMTSNSIIRECREKDVVSMTPLMSSSNYNMKNRYDFAFSNTKKTPLFNARYKPKTEDIRRDLFTLNETEAGRRYDPFRKMEEIDTHFSGAKPTDEFNGLRKFAIISDNIENQFVPKQPEQIPTKIEVEECVSAKITDNFADRCSLSSISSSSAESVTDSKLKTTARTDNLCDQNISVDGVLKLQPALNHIHPKCLRRTPESLPDESFGTDKLCNNRNANSSNSTSSNSSTDRSTSIHDSKINTTCKENDFNPPANVPKYNPPNNKVEYKQSIRTDHEKDTLENIPLKKTACDNRESDAAKPTKNENECNPVKNVPNQNGTSPVKTDIVNKKQFRVIPIKGKKYTILSKLGSGGSSEVFKVMDPKDSAMYAVKCVNLAVDHAVAENYVNEIKLLRRLQGSDRVVTMYDYDYIKSQKQLVVLLEMGDVDLSSLLKSYRTRGNSLPFPILVGYWTEMLSAVNHIHQNGIIHSDLKPANFLLVHGRLKLIDFGIASSMTSDATSVLINSTVGTFNYISPEAITMNKSKDEKAKITYRSDVWSLGCILYSMLYGHTPFSHISHLYGKIAALSNPNQAIDYPPIKDVPPVLMDALRWCLTFDVKMRPTVQELIDLPYINCSSDTRKKPKSNNRISMQTILKIKNALSAPEWQSVAELLDE